MVLHLCGTVTYHSCQRVKLQGPGEGTVQKEQWKQCGCPVVGLERREGREGKETMGRRWMDCHRCRYCWDVRSESCSFPLLIRSKRLNVIKVYVTHIAVKTFVFNITEIQGLVSKKYLDTVITPLNKV